MPDRTEEHNARTDRTMAAEDKVTVRNVMPLVRKAMSAAADEAAVAAAADEAVSHFEAHPLAGNGLRQPVVAIRLRGNGSIGIDHRTATRILRETLTLCSYCNALIDTDGLVERALTTRGFPVRVVVIPSELRFDASCGAGDGYTTILVFDTRDTATLFAGVPPK